MTYLRALIIFFMISLYPIISFGQVFNKTFIQADSITRQGYGYITRDILFVLGKAALYSQEQIVLDSLAAFLIKNDNGMIEVCVHTDTRANEQFSSNHLSMNRASSIVNYLIKKGVNSKRLKAKGFGSVSPLIPDAIINKTKDKDAIELMHQKNRRVEFIISPDLTIKTLSDTVNWNNHQYFVYPKCYDTFARVDPPDSLPNGHWLAYYSNKKIAFIGTYKDGELQDTFAIYDSDKERIWELYYFQNGVPTYYESYWYLNKKSKQEWKLEESILLNLSNDSITHHRYDGEGRLIATTIYVIPKNTSYFPFFRVYEGIDNYSVQEENVYYTDKGKFEYREINKNGKVTCFNKKGKRINCPQHGLKKMRN